MRAQEEMYRRIVEAVPEGIWIVDTQGQTVFCNKRMAEILGTDMDSMPGRSCFSCVFPDELPDAQRHFERNMAGDRYPFDFRLRRTDGSPIWVSISCMPMYDDAGATTGLLGLFTDVSERKRADAALRESEERFRNMADTAPVMIWVSGPDKLCTFFNQGWLNFTGRTMQQELGNGWAEGVHPEDLDRCFETYSSSFDMRRSFQMEYRLRGADGQYRWVLDNGIPRFGPGGEFAGYIGSCIDVTEVKRTQELALARQKLESVGVLAGGIAHDFNNLLGSILANSELAMAELPDGTPARDEVEAIKAVAIRASEVVRELMAYAGQENTVFEPVNVSRLVGEMLQLLKVSISKRAILKVDLPEGLPAVLANAAQIRQVAMNLITNASEALGDQEGTISISVEHVRRDRQSPAGSTPDLSQGDYLKLEVSDTGCGMTEEIRSKIFDPFFTTKFTGRGLGLAAVQGIIRGHGGTIDVVSTSGQGSRFEILLPCTSQPARDPRDAAVQASSGGAGSAAATILVIEDEDPLRLAVSKMLRMEGFSTIEAADGSTGMDHFRANALDIDVVLLDVTLPGLSGREVLSEVRRIRPDVKVVLTTAYSEDSTLATVGGQQPWLYIRKPYQLRQLADLLRNACPRKQASSRAAN